MTATQGGRLLILGVAASDSHAVANILIARYLRGLGFEVVNLGPCTPVAEFARACRDHPAAEAVLIGSPWRRSPPASGPAARTCRCTGPSPGSSSRTA